MTAIKLCGLREAAQVDLAAALGVEFIGLMFARRSSRHVTVEAAKRALAPLGSRPAMAEPLAHAGIPAGHWFQRCAAGLDDLLAARRPLVVGVFADQPPSLVNAIADEAGLDLVQLSGREPWDQALEIRRPVLKAVHVAGDATPAELIEQCEVGTAAGVLLDTAVRGANGGTGRAFDWSIAAGVGACLPIVLAGGLTPANVGEAITTARPWGVDVSSGIERDGMKDPALMEAFVRAVRDVPSAARVEGA